MVSPQLHFERGNRGCPRRMVPHIQPPKPFRVFIPSVLSTSRSAAATGSHLLAEDLSCAVKYTPPIAISIPAITVTSIVSALVTNVKRFFSGSKPE